ncbi:UNVERIFIED_CONTAM: ACS family hexuronate transporter-like MFS transporter [Brevibacillus sp. OAP136]
MAWVTLVLLFVLYMINYADKAIAGYSAVQIMQELQLSATQWGVVGSSFFWLFSIAGVLGAALSDKIGTKKMLAIMALSWTIVQFGAYAIASLPMLMGARILLGIGEGPFWATVVSHLSKWFPEERRGLVFSTVNFGAFVGAVAFAPLLVGIIESSGWRHSWAMLGAASLAWFLVWMWIGKEKPHAKAIAPEELIAKEPIQWKKLFAILFSTSFIFTFLIYFAQIWGTTFAAVWEPVYLVKVLGFTPKQMSYAIAGTGLLAGLMTIAISWYADTLYKKNRSYRKSYVTVGGISIILGGVFFYAMSVTHQAIWVLIAACLAKGFSFSVGTSASVIATSLMPERKGLIMGVLSGFVTIAGIISPIVTGAIVQAAGNDISRGFGNALIANGLLFVVFGILFLLYVKRNETGQRVQEEKASA